MSTVKQHYAEHLARIYPWLAGGLDEAISRGNAELEPILSASENNRIAVDLGAGFGMHAIPLAHRGCSVLAIDSSRILLDVLKSKATAMPLRIIEDDLLNFQKYLVADADLILCMGDTLAHLPSIESVERLFTSIADSLRLGGRMVATFRDYTTPLTEGARFIPVRSDRDRIFTCFLEYLPETVIVHDVLYERKDTRWELLVSTYKKIRLELPWVYRALTSRGFSLSVDSASAGMISVVATKFR